MYVVCLVTSVKEKKQGREGRKREGQGVLMFNKVAREDIIWR